MRNNSYFYLLWCVFLFSFLQLHGQDDWTFETHSNNVTGISIDSQWVWIATRDGIFKFNSITGERTKYSTEQSNLTDDFMTDILVTSDDSVWVSYYYFGAGHASLSPGNWENYEVSTSPLTSNFVRTMKRAPSGAIYMGTFYGGVNIYKNGGWSLISSENSPLPVSNYSGGIVQIAFEDNVNDQNVWFGTRYHGLYHQLDTTWVRYDIYNSPIPHEIISGLAIDHEKRVWIGTHDGLAVKDVNDQWEVFKQGDSPLPTGFVQDIAVGNDSLIWVATLQGLVSIPSETMTDFSTWKVYLSNNSGLPDNSVEKVEIDTLTGDLWVGTYSHGLVHFDGTSWDTFDFKDSDFVDNDVLSLNYTHDSTLLVCTLTGGLGIFQDSMWTILDEEHSGLPTNQVNYAAKDSAGNVWIGYSFNGLSMWNGDTIVHLNHLNSPLQYPLNVINDMYLDSLNRIWLAVNGGLWKFDYSEDMWTFFNADTVGIHQDVTAIEWDGADGFWYAGRFNSLKHFDGMTLTAYDTPDHFLEDAIVNDIVRDEWNNIWIGTSSKGLLKLDSDGNWFHFDASNSGIQGNNISCLEYTPDSTLWIGTTGVGMYSYKLGVINHYDVYSGHLPQNNVADLKWDGHGTLWIGMPQMGLGSHHITIYTKPEDTLGTHSLKAFTGKMAVYPNPVQDKLHLDLSVLTRGQALVSFVSMDGRVMQEDALGYLTPGDKKFELDVSGLPVGNYFLRLFLNGEVGSLGVFRE
ncbi:MAG TPA: hypothetical protein ENK85_06375 [Saprospiraceae bacterium]|nr:hypothetical protein [Saprospiraceae bacterium]